MTPTRTSPYPPARVQWLHGDFNFDGAVAGDDYLSIDANLGKGTPNSLAYADDQSEMIALHAEQFGGERYIKTIEQAMKLKHGKHLHRKHG